MKIFFLLRLDQRRRLAGPVVDGLETATEISAYQFLSAVHADHCRLLREVKARRHEHLQPDEREDTSF
jgi:hypothetical protein